MICETSYSIVATSDSWLEAPEPSATNLACVARLICGGCGVEGGELVDLASKSHRVIRVVT